jgi:hypothetical protein
MLLSLSVLLIPIVLLVGAYRFFYSGDQPIAVDASQTWEAARHSGRFPVLEPAGLPPGWTVISARYADGMLRIGYVTPASTGLQLLESDRPGDQLLPSELGAQAPPGNLTILNGRSWRAYPEVRGGGRALVLADNGRTVIVFGTAADVDVRTLAASLR